MASGEDYPLIAEGPDDGDHEVGGDQTVLFAQADAGYVYAMVLQWNRWAFAGAVASILWVGCGDDDGAVPDADGGALDAGSDTGPRRDSEVDGADGAGGGDGGQPLDGGPRGCPLRPGDGDLMRQVFRFEAQDPPLRVTIRRDYRAPGAGESTLFDLVHMTVEQGGVCTALDAPASLAYMNSHHNWLDSARGHNAELAYEVNLTFDTGVGRWTPTFGITRVDSGDVVLGPTALVTTGAPVGCWQCPGFVPVWIYEVQSNNTSTIMDEAGDFEPWIELFNPSADAVDLSGWGLTDDPAMPHKWTFAAGASLARHAVMIVWLDGEPGEGELHSSFRLGSAGGSLRLSTPDGTSSGERDFGPTAADASLSYRFDVYGFVETTSPTPGVDHSM